MGGKVEVDVAILAPDSPYVFASLAYLRPAFDLAAEVANSGKPEEPTINLKYLNVPPNASCDAVMADTDNLLAQWYYKERRPADKAISLIMLGGGCYAVVHKFLIRDVTKSDAIVVLEIEA